MSIEIVTGFQGVEHIEPTQVGRLLASLVGTKCYVVGEGDPLSATVRTANQVRIGAGEIIMQGRHITCESYTDLTIESGTTGYKRNDLVVCRYERSSSTGVESATLKVVKGTATAGTPSDPAYVSGSIIDNDLIVEMPLWRIPITNLTPGTPVKLFTALPYGTLDNILDRLATAEADIDDTRDSISRNTVLWSGEYFPNSDWSEDIDLPDHCSGVVVVWSRYDTNSLQSINADWNMHYIPRCFIERSNKIQMHFPVAFGASSKTISDKVLIVGDWKIAGDDSNVSGKQVNGFTVNSSEWVLRQIVAV